MPPASFVMLAAASSLIAGMLPQNIAVESSLFALDRQKLFRRPKDQRMCNLYNVTTTKEALRQLF